MRSMTGEVKTQCPLCPTGTPKATQENIARTDVRRCQRCRLQFVADGGAGTRPVSRLSPEEEFPLHRPFVAPQADHFKETVPDGAVVLQDNCGSGMFLDAIGDTYDRYGRDDIAANAAYVRDTGEIPCSTDPLADAFPNTSFTAIVSFDGLALADNPVDWLTTVKKRLIGGGWIYLEVPNVKQALNSAYDSPGFREAFYGMGYRTYWEGETLASLLGAVGFECRITQKQRGGLRSHATWMWLNTPLEDYIDEVGSFTPVAKGHPFAPPLNRQWRHADLNYRVQMETLLIADTLVATGRLREI